MKIAIDNFAGLGLDDQGGHQGPEVNTVGRAKSKHPCDLVTLIHRGAHRFRNIGEPEFLLCHRGGQPPLVS